MNFEAKLANYARIIVEWGLNVQVGQLVNISTEAIHRDFALLIAEKAYDKGAKHVAIDLLEPRATRLRLQKSKTEDLSYVPAGVAPGFDELVDEQAAKLKLLGMEYPDYLSDLDPKRINKRNLAYRAAADKFYEEGIGKSCVQWSVASAATPAWGQKVFPELSPEKAERKLWDELFRICRADQENCLELWRQHNERLHKRAKLLTEMKISQLHFKGPGTDLRVGLSPLAKFGGGTKKSQRGVPFLANIPTEEVFTTPDWRVTQGSVQATRPFLINGKLIRNLKMRFEKGEIVEFSADDGADTFEEYINTDEGARRLGEVALVGIDSPIYQSNLTYQEILLDENAACHIAVGFAYKSCLVGGETMSDKELEEVGRNDSSVHTDMMISSEQVDVTAHTTAGKEVLLLEKGRWVI